MDNAPARSPKRAVRIYPSRFSRPRFPAMPDEDRLEESHPPTDENAVDEWAAILAADAPPLSERQTARLRRLFDVRGPGVRG